MPQPKIECEDRIAEFADDLSDEALDRPGEKPASSLCPVFPSAPAR